MGLRVNRVRAWCYCGVVESLGQCCMSTPLKLFLSIAISTSVACSPSPTSTAPQTAVSKIPEESFHLPVSLNEVMVALVNPAADPLWVAAWKSPKTDKDWRELERRAYQLELAGALIAFPGTGALDESWAAKPPWQRWSNQLRDVGRDAIEAVQARDLTGIAMVGDRTVEICEGCHADFKLPFPTQGVFGDLSPTPSDNN